MISALVAAGLAWTAWRRRPGSGVIPFTILMVALVIWTIAQALEFMFGDFRLKVVALNLEYVGITMVPAGWLAFVLQYTGRGQWLTRRRVAALFIEPILVLLLSATNDYHHLFRTSLTLDTTGPLGQLQIVSGLAFWVHAVYSYLLLLTANALLIQAFIRSPELYRG